MSDLVERLRDHGKRDTHSCADLCIVAADEIERLQHLLDEFKKRLSDRTAEAMRLHKIIKA